MKTEQMNSVDLNDLLTVKHSAELAGVSEHTVRAWLRDGKLPRVKLGSLTRVRAEDIRSKIDRDTAENLRREAVRLRARAALAILRDTDQ